MTTARPAGDAGFLLVEAIVAFLILSIALAVGVQSVSQGAASLRRADEAAAAAIVARELFATRAVSLTEPGAWSGTHPNGAAWRLAATQVPDGRPLPLYRVTVEVQPERARSVYDYQGFAVGAPRP